MHFLAPWESSPAITIIIGVAAIFYTLGSIACHTPWLRRCSFWLGLALMYFVLHPYFEYYSRREFFAHCLQHILLHHDGPFFIALSMPASTLMAGMPKAWRNYVTRWVNFPKVQYAVRVLNRPVLAVSLFCAINIFWMIPSVHFAAMLDQRVNSLMNWSMAINGLMFWNLVLNDYCLRPGKLPPARRIMMMLAVVPPQIVLGLLVFSVRNPLYMAYGLCGRVVPGISPLLDQQIGGFILWVPAVMMSVIGVLAVIGREWFRQIPVALPASPATSSHRA
jgi:putative membrane protein